MNDTRKDSFADRTIWVRLLYMLFCAIAWSVAELVLAIVALFQFLCVLVNGAVHERALRFGRNLSEYMTELMQFVTFNAERVPFPFSDWPDETPGDTPWRAAAGAPPENDPDAEPPDTPDPGR
jgi:hypothetical protein